MKCCSLISTIAAQRANRPAGIRSSYIEGMRFLPFTTRDLFWLLLLVAMAGGAMLNGHDALRQLLAVLTVIAVICWFVAAS